MLLRRNPDRRGNFAVIFTALITVLLSFAALAIDVSYIRNCRMQLTNAVDAAAHAALLEYRRSSSEGAAVLVAQSVAASNKVGGKPVTVDPADVVFGSWDYDTRTFSAGGTFINAVQVNASRDGTSSDGPIDLFLAPIMGIETATADSSAVGAFRFREMMLVLDVTGSFQLNMDNARGAMVDFLDLVHDTNFPQDTMGLVLFANVATVFDELQSVSTNYSTLRAHWVGNGVTTCNNCTSITNSSDFNPDITGLQVCHKCDRSGCNPDGNYTSSSNTCRPPFDRCDDVDDGNASVHTYVSCKEGAISGYNEGTAHAPGLELAIDELEAAGTNGNVKVIVLLSDGKPQCRIGGEGGITSDESITEPCPAQRAYEAQLQTARAQDAAISIYTVSFCNGCNSTKEAEQYAFMQTLISGSGKAYSTTEGDDLSGILEDIARSLPVALVE